MGVQRIIYKVYNDDSVVFLTLPAAEDYLMVNYCEYYCGKDSFMELCENMIEEYAVNG